MSQPHGLFFVTNDGRRIPFDVKFHHIDETEDVRFWTPVIEGDLNRIMPSVVMIDGPSVDWGEVIMFENAGPGWETAAWGELVMANSRHVFSSYKPGDLE